MFSTNVARAAETRPVTTLSRTLRPLNKARFWKVRATPSRASRWVGTLRKRRPEIDTVPWSAW